MKVVSTVARILLGLMFLVFGSNMFLHFIPQGAPPPGLAGEFAAVLFKAHYFYPVGAVMVFSAVLFLANRFVALGLVLLGPVLVNILLFHVLMAPAAIGMGLFATLLWAVVFWRERGVFAGLWVACPCR